jgi:hypothetical protein
MVSYLAADGAIANPEIILPLMILLANEKNRMVNGRLTRGVIMTEFDDRSQATTEHHPGAPSFA